MSMQDLYTPGSPHLLNKEIFDFESQHDWHADHCSICATLYRGGDYSYRKIPPIMIDHSDSAIYIKFDKEKTKGERADATLLYGSSLRHTEKAADPEDHKRSQKILLQEAYDLLMAGRAEKPKGDTVIMYIKTTNPVEKAKKSEGDKCTHPHVWIVDTLPYYGAPDQTYFLEENETPYELFIRTVEYACETEGRNPDCKVYLKFNIRVEDCSIISCDIDVEP